MANTNSRSTRSANTRESETRRKPWQPPSMLETPTAPDGYKYRWLRAEMMGEEDRGNMSKRLREGYEIVRPEELATEDRDKYSVMSIGGGQAGVVGVGGLILGKIPVETAQERNAYYSQQTSEQLHAIDNELQKASNPVMPIGAPIRKTQTEFGNPENRGDSEES